MFLVHNIQSDIIYILTKYEDSSITQNFNIKYLGNGLNFFKNLKKLLSAYLKLFKTS